MLEERIFKSGNIQMNYLISAPDNYAELPLLIYLHGAGERGNNIDHLYRHAIPNMIKNEGKEYPAVILCPQCPAKAVWNNVVFEVKELIDGIIDEFGIMKDRILLTGSSMGGYGTWEMALTFRNFFAAIAPIAGGGMTWRCEGLKSTPVFAYHGAKDPAVKPISSIEMVNAVNESGGKASLTFIKDMMHQDAINYAYSQTDLIENLLLQRRTDFTYIPDVCEDMF